ncbi:MAG: response regulator [Alphaproteobacteria bacterium]|nr:response regulator [Alphaproteobacteria bacterium]
MAKSVLIVDDESYIVTSLSFVMKNAGFETGSAGDGEEALEKVAAMVPDLVILDVMMPKKDGFEVCKEIRANPEWKSVRIMMLTAKGRDSEREKGLALGADEYLTKPFSTRDILARVQEMLAVDRVAS